MSGNWEAAIGNVGTNNMGTNWAGLATGKQSLSNMPRQQREREPTIMVECTEADVRTLLNDTLTKLRDMAAGMLQGTKPRRDDGFDRMARYLEEARTLTHRLREFRPVKEDAK